jgi:hypothetical protein
MMRVVGGGQEHKEGCLMYVYFAFYFLKAQIKYIEYYGIHVPVLSA